MVEGWAALEGTWTGDRLMADRQAPPRREPPVPSRWTSPPCPPPEAGWPTVVRRGDIELDYHLGDLGTSGAAVAVTLFRPGPEQVVLVVAAADVAAVEARLRPQLGASLCVVPSRCTKAELDQAHAHLSSRLDSWNIHRMGVSSDADGQARIVVNLTMVTPEIAAWAASAPPGVADLRPWLSPIS